MKHSGENEIPIIFLKIRIFFSRKSDFFLENIRNSGFHPCTYTTFRKHTKSGVWSLSEFPCFIVYAARNIPSISDTMWCKAGFILRTPKIRRPRSAHCSHDQRLAPVSKTGALTIIQDGTSARENVGRRINQHYALTPRCTTVYTQYNRANRYLNK